MSTKTIYLKTNYNNKLACDSWLHIDIAPKKWIPLSQLEDLRLEVRTSDNSYPSTTNKIVDILLLDLNQLGSIHTLPSHGKDCFEFIKDVMSENPELKPDSKMAVYYYVKVAS